MQKKEDKQSTGLKLIAFLFLAFFFINKIELISLTLPIHRFTKLAVIKNTAGSNINVSFAIPAMKFIVDIPTASFASDYGSIDSSNIKISTRHPKLFRNFYLSANRSLIYLIDNFPSGTKITFNKIYISNRGKNLAISGAVIQKIGGDVRITIPGIISFSATTKERSIFLSKIEMDLERNFVNEQNNNLIAVNDIFPIKIFESDGSIPLLKLVKTIKISADDSSKNHNISINDNEILISFFRDEESVIRGAISSKKKIDVTSYSVQIADKNIRFGQASFSDVRGSFSLWPQDQYFIFDASASIKVKSISDQSIAEEKLEIQDIDLFVDVYGKNNIVDIVGSKLHIKKIESKNANIYNLQDGEIRAIAIVDTAPIFAIKAETKNAEKLLRLVNGNSEQEYNKFLKNLVEPIISNGTIGISAISTNEYFNYNLYGQNKNKSFSISNKNSLTLQNENNSAFCQLDQFGSLQQCNAFLQSNDSEFMIFASQKNNSLSALVEKTSSKNLITHDIVLESQNIDLGQSEKIKVGVVNIFLNTLRSIPSLLNTSKNLDIKTTKDITEIEINSLKIMENDLGKLTIHYRPTDKFYEVDCFLDFNDSTAYVHFTDEKIKALIEDAESIISSSFPDSPIKFKRMTLNLKKTHDKARHFAGEIKLYDISLKGAPIMTSLMVLPSIQEAILIFEKNELRFREASGTICYDANTNAINMSNFILKGNSLDINSKIKIKANGEIDISGYIHLKQGVPSFLGAIPNFISQIIKQRRATSFSFSVLL